MILEPQEVQELKTFILDMPTKYGMPLLNFFEQKEKQEMELEKQKIELENIIPIE